MPVRRRAAQAGGGVALRIEIDQQSASAGLGQPDRQIDGGGGFSHASFLIGDAKDAAHGRGEGEGQGTRELTRGGL